MKGRLRRAVGLWREINPPQFILDVIAGRFCVRVTTCFPLTRNRTIIMCTFFLITVNTFLFRGHFRAVVLGFFHLQCFLLASAEHLIFLRNCSSLWLRNGDQKPRGLLFYLDYSVGSATGYKNAKIASLQVHADLCR